MSVTLAKPSCSVDDCDSPRRKREWCGRHYQAWRRHGDPTVAVWTWSDKSAECIACGQVKILPGYRQFCSRACQQASYRTRLGEANLADTVSCQGCGDAIPVHRENGRRIRRGNTKWCDDCYRQREKHRVAAKVIARRDGTACGQCGETVDFTLLAPDPLSPSIDRIIPRSRGGSDDPENLQLAHRRCNQSKGDLLPAELAIRCCTEFGCDLPLANRAMGLCARHMQPFWHKGTVPPEMRGRKAFVRLTI